MSGSGTIYTEQSVLGHTLGFQQMAFPAQVFVGLCSVAMPPSETVQGIEAFGGGYMRMPATFALIDTPANIAANVASVEWPIATAGWGTLGFFELWDAPAGGNRLYWGALIDTTSQLPTTITVGSGDIVRFSAGTLAVQAATGSGGTGSVGAYLPLTGGRLTGAMWLAGDPTDYLQPATKQYVDAHSGTGGGPGFLPLSGGAMLGSLTLSGNATQPLHAVPLQQVNTAAAGGPFLPLSVGGTVTGGVEIATSPVVAGLLPTAFYTNTAASGSTTSTGQGTWNGWLTTDQMAAPNADSIANHANYYTVHNSTGPRIAEQISLVVGPTSDGFKNGMFHQALGASAVAKGNLGGTSGAYSAALFGANITSTLQSGATYLVGVVGLEVNVAAQVGSSCEYKTGFQVVLQGGDAVDSLQPATAFGISLNVDSPSSPGFARAISIGGGSSAYWPLNTTNGVIMWADPGSASGGPARQCASGIDFSGVTFSQHFLNSIGFSVDGAGNIATAGSVNFGSGSSIKLGAANIMTYVSPGAGAHAFYVAASELGYWNTGGVALAQGGFNCSGVSGASPADTSTGLTFYNGGAGNVYGIGLTSGRLNHVTGAAAAHAFVVGAADRLTINATGMGFNGTPAVAKPTVSGAKGGNVALASLLTALAAYGLVNDTTTA